MTFQLKTVNFGTALADATGSNGVGYTLINMDGSYLQDRTTTDVYQVMSGSGIYSAFVDFDDHIHGQIIWSTGTVFQKVAYAADEFNAEIVDPTVIQLLNYISGSMQTLVDVAVGNWKIENNQMVCFSSIDSTTPIATFNLYDDVNTPSVENVFKRVRV